MNIPNPEELEDNEWAAMLACLEEIREREAKTQSPILTG
jgi:hypothetical protein